MTFVDTNYFLRLLLADNKDQYLTAKKLFQDGASGKVKLFSSTIVFFEIYWVLHSFYKQKKAKIIKALFAILKMNFVRFEEENLLIKAVKIFKNTNLDLEDSYNLVYAQKNKTSDFMTFDKKLRNKFKNNL